jgi:PAS domain S-box-containing protein
VAIAWIVLSDRVVGRLFPNGEGVLLQSVKGAAFVLVTSALLYALVARRGRTLRALSDEVRATIDGMVDAVLIADERGNIIRANRAAADLLGLDSPSDLLGPVAEIVQRLELRAADGTPIPPSRGASQRALAGERVAPFDGILRRADGRDVFVSIAASPIAAAGTRPRAAVTVIRDISSARRFDELRDEFLSTAAHEFKTPLAVIKAYAQLLQKRDPAEAPGLVVIQRQVDRLNRLVQHLLDATRLRLDGQEGPRERFDLSDVAAEVVERMRRTAPAHALSLAAAPAAIVADRERIARVITSLVENAVRFSPGGGPVAARVEVRDGAALFSIEDRGLGIPLERQDRIFERFYRAHADTPNDYGGLGLGLEMSREIVQRHGGRMWFESAPGRGSTFHFSLPLAEAAP